VVELARDVRVFRARLADAFDAARDGLLREFAYAVLGRELVLAPADIATIAARLLAEHPGAEPLRLRVAPADALTLARDAGALPPIASDAELAPGDAVLEFAGGSIDARLGVRLAALLERPARTYRSCSVQPCSAAPSAAAGSFSTEAVHSSGRGVRVRPLSPRRTSALRCRSRSGPGSARSMVR
jgi:hypothetical protein